MAEFAASNHVNTLISMTSFFADHKFHSHTGIEPLRMYKDERQAELLAVDKIVPR